MKKHIALLLLITLIITLPVGCKKDEPQADPAPGQEQSDQPQPTLVEEEILLFYPDKNNNFLLPEFRKVIVKENAGPDEMVEIVLGELIKGTENEMLSSTIPAHTEVLSFGLDGSSITIDFSEGFIVDSYSSREKLLQVFSVVNTLSELGIEEMNLFVEGEPVSGHYTSLEAEMPFIRNDELIPSK
jgi:spore germination protein GerM